MFSGQIGIRSFRVLIPTGVNFALITLINQAKYESGDD
jgi:hypothetical protein